MPPESSFGILSAAAARPTSPRRRSTISLDLVLALVGVLAKRERRVVEDVHRAEERAVLEQDAELLPHLEQLLVGHVRHRLAVHQHVALVRVEQADHVLDADRLAGAGRAQDHRDLVVRQAEVEPVQDAVAAERLDDVDELDGVVRAVLARAAAVPLVLVGLAPASRARGSSRPCSWPASAAPRCGSLPLLLGAGRSSCSSGVRDVSSQSRGVERLRVGSSLRSALLAHVSLTRLSGLSDSSPRRSVCPPFRRGGPSRCSTPSTSPSRCRLPPVRRSAL